MRVDAKPDHPAEAGEERLPPRERPAGAEAARARMLERVVAGGVVPAEPSAVETIGGHRLVRRLGRGGMGDVWEGVKEGDASPVAIKVLRAAALVHEPTRKRFLREARTAASVRHPGIVQIFDVGSTEAGTPYIVMELLEGRPLEALVREHGALPWAAAREILLQVADALAFAHSCGVIHRDLKPANVMVAGDLQAPRCTIIDFGLARREVIASGSESLSHTGEVFGSPPFMSPEQFRGDEVDARSDVYGFGCAMFCVLTGRRPFEGEKIGELMYQHLFQAAPEPDGMKCPPELRAALASIVLRALRKAPEHRFATMDELAQALRRLDDDPRPVPLPPEDPIGSVAAPRATSRGLSRSLPWIVAGVAAAVGLAATMRTTADPAPAEPHDRVAPSSVTGEPASPSAADDRSASARVAPEPVAPAPARASPPSAVTVPEPEPEPASEPARARARKPKIRAIRERPDPEPEPAPPPAAEPAADPAEPELPPNPFRSP
jgi:serine/threonine protein kinase